MTNNTKTDRLYFPNLNGVRFLAALGVIVHHIEQYKNTWTMPSLWFSSPFIKQIGPLGVTLFFVLSGFLITYLLLTERERTQTVAIKEFYLRRILRIWPLYYTIVILAIFILPKVYMGIFVVPIETEHIYDNFGVKMFFILTILPNVIKDAYISLPLMEQTWSIGVEEQFYYFWPWVVKLGKNRLLVLMIFLLVFFYVLRAIGVTLVPDGGNWKLLKSFLSSLRMTAMILGGMIAYATFFHGKSKFVKIIFHQYFQVGLWLLLIILQYFSIYFPAINQEVYSIIFAILIANLAVNPLNIVSLENPIFNYLGKISYGLYMYHLIAASVVIKYSIWYFGKSNWAIYIGTIGLTVIFASISYHFLEKPFLKIKHRFTTVKSGNPIN